MTKLIHFTIPKFLSIMAIVQALFWPFFAHAALAPELLQDHNRTAKRENGYVISSDEIKAYTALYHKERKYYENQRKEMDAVSNVPVPPSGRVWPGAAGRRSPCLFAKPLSAPAASRVSNQ